MIRRVVTLCSLIALLLQSYIAGNACGPSFLSPIFVFEESPDLPFAEFAAGKIGIVKPTFGRKTLVISYRYLNGESFTADEQKQLVLALQGAAPEEDADDSLKAWISLRKELTTPEELPEIYRERSSPFGYDYFPNCAKNAFEVATATLKARIASYGADDLNVREWVRGQDEVFRNCSGNSPAIPSEMTQAAPLWLRKDRDYQIAAALFYSMQFEEARTRFEKIADDAESDWQATADYLVARTLVRHASLIENKEQKSALYAKAEERLRRLINGNVQFGESSQKMLGLIRYRIHPEERVAELADVISRAGTSRDVRQDLIDYVWLVDKFESQVLEQEQKRREALKRKEAGENEPEPRSRAIGEDELTDQISVSYSPRFADGTPDYRHSIVFSFPYQLSESEMLRQVEARLDRKLTDDESKALSVQIKSAVDHRRWLSSYNLKVNRGSQSYEGGYYASDVTVTYNDIPEFLRINDLTDWIFAMELGGPEVYEHAFTRWRETGSTAWLVAALTNAESKSPNVKNLMQAAERISPDTPAFATLAFQLVRLKTETGQHKEALQLLDIVSTNSELLPLSAQNEFQAQRLTLARDLTQFLKYAARKPIAFYGDGTFVTIRELVEARKLYWSDYEGQTESKEEYETRLEREFKELLTDDLRLFDDHTNDLINRHFSTAILVEALRDPQTTSYLRRRLTLLLFTRALLLNNHEVAAQVAPHVIKTAPEIAALVTQYVEAKTVTEREQAALFLLLKSPGLTPFFTGDLEQVSLTHSDYYLESAWWCAPEETEYNAAGEAVQKTIEPPAFLDARQVADAKQEFEKLADTADAKTYLAKRVLEWARTSPDDPRIPEALLIAFWANGSYKYGCNGWEHDEEIQRETSALLRERYPRSPWTAKLPAPDGH